MPRKLFIARPYNRLLAGLLLGILFVAGCGEQSPPEVRVRAVIDAIEQAAETRSLDGVAEHVADDYSDTWHDSRRAALRSLLVYFQGHQNIHLLTRISDIRLSDDQSSALVTVYVGMAGRPVESAEALLTVNAELYRFDVELQRDGDSYRVMTARWRRASVEDFIG
jgi:hypothetical protein